MPRSTLYLCALALAGCGGDPGTSASASSGGQTSATSDDDTSSGETSIPTSGTGETSETGTSGPVATSSSSGEASTSTTTSTTSEPDEAAPNWALVDVNPNSATYEQTRSRSDYAGRVSGWYFAHAT
jgi:hypothetical protein